MKPMDSNANGSSTGSAAPSPDEIVRRGEAIYERSIRGRVEPAHNGEFLVINIDTGEYEMDADDARAVRRSRERFPDALLFSMRVGHDAAYRLGGRFQVRPAC